MRKPLDSTSTRLWTVSRYNLEGRSSHQVHYVKATFYLSTARVRKKLTQPVFCFMMLKIKCPLATLGEAEKSSI